MSPGIAQVGASLEEFSERIRSGVAVPGDVANCSFHGHLRCESALGIPSKAAFIPQRLDFAPSWKYITLGPFTVRVIFPSEKGFPVVITPSLFGFASPVWSGGYRWYNVNELGDVYRPIGVTHVNWKEKGPYLGHNDKGEFVYRPTGGNLGLYRDFASIDPTDANNIIIFANQFGFLLGHSRLDDNSPPASSWGVVGHPFLEPIGVWVNQIAMMRAVIGVLDAVREDRESDLRKMFSWLPIKLPEGAPSESAWFFDSNPTADHGKSHWDRIRRFVYGEPIGSPFDSVRDVALAFLAKEVNHCMGRSVGIVYPMLSVETVAGRKVLRERFHIETLYNALWSQLFAAIVGNVEHRRCQGCPIWFEIGSRDSTGRLTTARKNYCSETCRQSRYQKRKERALALASEGKSTDSIVKQLISEGHNTDVASVRKWIKSTPKK